MSHQFAPPGPPAITLIVVEPERQQHRLLEPLVDAPAARAVGLGDARRARIEQRQRAIDRLAHRAAGVARRSFARSSQAASMVCCKSSVMPSPIISCSQCGDIAGGEIDEAAVGVGRLFGAVVDPHRRHADRLGRRQVARHVVDEQALARIDAERRAQPGIGVRMRLGHIAAWRGCRASPRSSRPARAARARARHRRHRRW